MNRYKLKVNSQTTIHDVADYFQERHYQNNGEAQFTRSLLLFDRLVESELEQVLEILKVANPGQAVFELAICWLARRDYQPEGFLELMQKMGKNLPGIG